MFPLLRYFSISSAIVTVLVTAGFVAIHRAHEIADIIHEAEDDNAGMARTIANVIWLRYGSQLEELRGSTKAQILALPVIADLQKEVRTIKKGLPILKTKVNLPDGLIVFSSLQEEIGFNRNAIFYEGKYDEDFSAAAPTAGPACCSSEMVYFPARSFSSSALAVSPWLGFTRRLRYSF